MVVEQQRRQDVAFVSTEHWKTAVTETSMRMAMASIDRPHDRARLAKIVGQSGLLRELSGFAHTLATNDQKYAKDVLGWAYQDFEKRGVYVNPQLLKAVRRRLK